MNRNIVCAGLLWILTVGSIAMWALAPGVEVAGAQRTAEELRVQLRQVKRMVSDVEEMVEPGRAVDRPTREKAAKILLQAERQLAEVRRLLPAP
jgi:hypothetical protein